MKNYTRTYLTVINELTDDNDTFVPCECCGGRSTEIHHILNKNRLIEHGILNLKDTIENIMAICRGCHDEFGDKDGYLPILLKTHSDYISNHTEIDMDFINALIRHYE